MKKVFNYRGFITENMNSEEIKRSLTGNVEIFKELETPDTKLSEEEEKILYGLFHKRYRDEANNLEAFDLKTNNFIFADELTGILNEIDDSWYVGDPTEEYVYVD